MSELSELSAHIAPPPGATFSGPPRSAVVPPINPMYLVHEHVHRQVQADEADAAIEAGAMQLLLLGADGQKHWLDTGKRYPEAQLRQAIADGRLYIIHATRWSVRAEMV